MALLVKKHRQRTIDKMHILIRAELANPQMTSTDIAAICGLSIWKFSVLKATPLYKQLHNAYMSGLLSNMDGQIHDTLNIKKSRETLNLSIPLAFQVLYKQMMESKDERVRNKAANDLLDRHGVFVKATRTTVVTEGDRAAAEDKDNKQVLEMMKALEAIGGSTNTPPPTTPALTIDSSVVSENN